MLTLNLCYMKKTFLFLFVLLTSTSLAIGQYYYIPYLAPEENPGGLNTDDESQGTAGWATILPAGLASGANSTTQNLPFPFNFNGSPVSFYQVNNNGILSFDQSTSITTGAGNASLPSALVPDKSLCLWGLSGTGMNDIVLTKTFGTAPNRQHWITFSSYTFSSRWSYWAIVLEEGSESIYFVDQRHQSSYSGLTIGIQIDAATAIQLQSSPNSPALAQSSIKAQDNVYYEFVFGQQPQYDISMNELDFDLYLSIDEGPFEIQGSFINVGSDSIFTYDLNYRVNGGTIETGTITSNIGSREEANFKHPKTWLPGAPGSYTLEVWSSNINGNPDEVPSNDTSITSFIVSPTIPNIIDDYVAQFPIFTVMGTVLDRLNSPMDLDFHPDLSRKELWVVNFDSESSGGSTVTFSNAGAGNQSAQWRRDGNAWHFMSMPTALAFSSNGNFATSPAIFDANHNGGDPFTGPSLWSSDPAIYAQPSGGNGSHLDMLHASPNSLGIASEKGNAFWLADGFNSQIVRYDFVEDHGPGNDYHGDGEIQRVTDFSVSLNQSDIPGHLVLDKSSGWLYIVDGGNKRILRMDINSGTAGGTPLWGPFETLAEYTNLSNTTWEVLIDSGLVAPAGIEVIGDRLLVSDYTTGHIIIYDIGGAQVQELRRLRTGKPGITGIKIGPEGYIWYTNSLRDEVSKIEMAGVGITPILPQNTFSIFPNPARDMVFLKGESDAQSVLQLRDVQGRLIQEETLPAFNGQASFSVENLSSGLYLVQWHTEDGMGTRKLIVE